MNIILKNGKTGKIINNVSVLFDNGDGYTYTVPICDVIGVYISEDKKFRNITMDNENLLNDLINKEVIEKKIKYFKNKINDVDTKLYYLDDKIQPITVNNFYSVIISILQEILEENKNDN